MFKKFNIYIKNSIIKYFNMLDEKNYYKKHYAHITMKIFVSQVFPRALPLRLGESTFTVPRPSLKPLKKEPFASYIYIEKGRPFWLLFASFFRLWKNVRAKSEAFRRVPQSSSFRILV